MQSWKLVRKRLCCVKAAGRGEEWWAHDAHSTPLDSYLVDSASSHMLVSKIKPCMSKYKQLIL
ncbi:hypothetical protein IE81DRAFT_352133 [Ceraceosorus guamensis]|uniref:Uncharacterized protein n=1 Tax=Ceraceosorus guamensis TaxID=1522189 RepID=A0A316VPL8_9BASI|nr:hypothetical protein IE81DRAFT_352133 [Ceraceosorus guamensis]PWN39517.1 hypothetical protein IE81DRAFT_352133 [Ceraceosorus guamensis]